MDLGLLILQWKQQDRMVEFHREVKKCPFLKLNCAIMEKEQNFILGLDKFQTAQRTQKKKNSFSNSATNLFEAWSSCTQI